MSHELAEARALADYFAEFSVGDRRDLGTVPGTLAPLLPGTTTSPMPTTALVQRMPALYRQNAEAVASSLVGAGVLPASLPSGSTPFYTPSPPPDPPPSTPQAWTERMWTAKLQTDGLEAAALVLRNRGTLKQARTENPDAHILNNYSWREYRIPSSGVCDPASLTWFDIWFRAKDLLGTMATPPLRGVAGASIRLWAVNIGRLTNLLVESTNIRSPSFFAPPFTVVATTWNGGPRISTTDPVPGLASTAQGNGGYYYNTRGDTAASFEAMQYAPQPSGGYEEIFHGGAEAWLRPRTVFKCVDSPHCKLTLDLSSVLDQAFNGWGMTGRTIWDFQVVYRMDSTRLARAQVDVSAFVDNALNLARVMSDARLSLAQVLMRSTSFYVNAYLDYAGRRGVIAEDVVNNARAAWAGIKGSADANLNTAVSTTAGAIVAVATAINAAAGAIIGVVLGLLSALTAAEGAAVGTGPTVPVPFYFRVYGGSCTERAWLPPPITPVLTVAVPNTTAPMLSPSIDDTPPSAGSKAPLAIGGAALALWLLLGRK